MTDDNDALNPHIYYLVEHNEAIEGNMDERERVVARFDDRATPIKRGLELWHEDKSNEMAKTCDVYIDGTEEADTTIPGQMQVDYTMCANPGCVWVCRVIYSSFDRYDKQYPNTDR